MKLVTAIFLKGLFTILPLVVTVVVLFWLCSTAERTLGIGIKWVLPDAWYVPGMGVVAGILLTFICGMLVNIWGVPQLIRLSERFVGRIPLVKTIYGAVRDLLGFFSKSDDLGEGKKVVIVSLGDTGIRVVGLLTRENFDDLPAGFDDVPCVAVYIPYSYQIGGFTFLIPRDHVRPIDMSLEDAMRFVVTAGVNVPVRRGIQAKSPPAAHL